MSTNVDSNVGHCVPAAQRAPSLHSPELGDMGGWKCCKVGMGRGNAAAGHFFHTRSSPEVLGAVGCPANHAVHPVSGLAAFVPSATCFWRGSSCGSSHFAARQCSRVRGRALPRGWPLCKVAGICPVGDGHVLSPRGWRGHGLGGAPVPAPWCGSAPGPAPSAAGSGQTFACGAGIGPGGGGGGV